MSDIIDIQKIEAQVKQAILTRNVVTITEFAQYHALFDNSIRTSGFMDPQELKELCEKYCERFSQIHPIIIVSDDKKEVLQVRPQALIQFPSFNETIVRDDVLIDTFVNITTSESQPIHKKVEIQGTLAQAFNVAKNSKKFQSRVEKAIELEKKCSEGTSTKSSNKSKKQTNGATSGMTWE